MNIWKSDNNEKYTLEWSLISSMVSHLKNFDSNSDCFVEPKSWDWNQSRAQKHIARMGVHSEQCRFIIMCQSKKSKMVSECDMYPRFPADWTLHQRNFHNNVATILPIKSSNFMSHSTNTNLNALRGLVSLCNSAYDRYPSVWVVCPAK